MKEAKLTIRDSVFSDLFRDKRYLLKLYQTLHPEDTETTEDDLVDVTIQNVLTNNLYNDLGFRNKDRIVILTEAQSSWSVNIVVRAFLYLAQTWNDYIDATNQNRYGSRKLSLPKPEVYVIFSGDRQERPEYLSLTDEFFGGEKGFLDIRVKMLYGDGEDFQGGKMARDLSWYPPSLPMGAEPHQLICSTDTGNVLTSPSDIFAPCRGV